MRIHYTIVCHSQSPIILISIGTFGVFFLFSLSSTINISPGAHAQSNNNSMVWFDDTTNGVIIQYPTSWTKYENKTDPNNLVKFDSPEKNAYTPIVEVQVGILESPQRLNINDYLDYHANATRNQKDYQLVESNTNSSLSRQPAYKLAYFYTDTYGIKKEWIEMGTFIDSKLYWIGIITDADQTSNYLPTIQQMIDSFQISSPSLTSLSSPSNTTPVNITNLQPNSTSYSFITKWGTYGTGDGQFNGSGAVAVDSSGNVYVGDFNNNRIQKFDSNGTFITKWGSAGQGDGQFNYPLAAAIKSSSDTVYIADKGNNRIQVFAIANSTGENGTSMINSTTATTAQQQPSSSPTTQTGQQSSANFSEYQSPNFGFSIAYPVNWTAKEHPQGVSFVATQGPYARMSVNVTENNTYQNMNLNDYTNIKIKQLRSEFKGFHFVNENDTFLGTRPAHYLLYSFETNSTSVGAVVVYTIIGNRVYELDVITSTTNFDDMIPIIKHGIETFKVSESVTSGNQTTNNNTTKFRRGILA